MATTPSDAHLAALVAELSGLSPRFAQLWASHHVRGKTGDHKRVWGSRRAQDPHSRSIQARTE